MELTHLRYFIAVAEELHFGRAAEKMHIAQPPLSQQIKRLEDELDVKLFNRSSRRVELTEAGRIFLPEARAIIQRADEACSTLYKLAKGKSGYFAVAFSEPAINTFLPGAIKEFMEKYPDVQLSLNELGILEQFHALDEKRIHLSFMRPFGHDTEAYSKRLIMSERYLTALPAGHKLCSEAFITLDMLKDEPLILFPRSKHPHLRSRFDECFHDCGFEPMVIEEMSSKHTTLSFVAAGVALTLVPESSMVYSLPGVEFKELKSKLPPVEIYALWRPENESPMIKNLLDLVPNVEQPE
jgi:DNA-binding transcriptional LysR family regulator